MKEGKGAEDGVARMRLSEAASDEERPDDGAYRSTLDDPFTLNAAKQPVSYTHLTLPTILLV